MPRKLLIRPKMEMPSTATGRFGGIFVMIKEDNGEMRPLPHIPFSKRNGSPMFHSPDGFGIGYAGSGPSDLAIAICHLFNKPKLANEFKFQVIAKLDRNKDYDIPLIHIEALLERIASGKPV